MVLLQTRSEPGLPRRGVTLAPIAAAAPDSRPQSGEARAERVLRRVEVEHRPHSPALLPPLTLPSSSTALTSDTSGLARRAAVTKAYTGIGVVPSYQRSQSFITVGAVEVVDMADEAAGRKVRAQRSRVDRDARPTKKRGAHVHAPLRLETLPSWPYEWPRRVAEAGDAFDRRHRKRWDQAEGVYNALSRDLTHLAKQDAFEQMTLELRLNRFTIPSSLEGVKRCAPWELYPNSTLDGARRCARPRHERALWQVRDA